MVELLVHNRADVNAREDDGSIPLHLAAARGPDVSVVAFLIANGANVNARDNNGRTPLDHVRHGGIFQFLKKHGAKE